MGVQRGAGFGSILGSIFRNVVVPTAKSVGKSLLKTGLKKASNVMRGVAEGQNVGDAMIQEFIPRQPRQLRQAAAKRTNPAPMRRGQKRKRKSIVRAGKVRKRDIFS